MKDLTKKKKRKEKKKKKEWMKRNIINKMRESMWGVGARTLNPKIRKKRDAGRRVRSSCRRGLEIIFQISFFFNFY
jgi:hypothetical protein